MSELHDPEKLRARAQDLIEALSGVGENVVLSDAKTALSELCSARLYEPMCDLAEAICRRDFDPTTRRLYAQALIERGLVTTAIDMLEALAVKLDGDHPEMTEATGLLGRCHKQIFVDAGDKEGATVLASLEAAIVIYRTRYKEHPSEWWHGINYIALMFCAQRAGLEIGTLFDVAAAAAVLIDRMESLPAAERDDWHAPTLAEASLARGDWDAAEAHIASYAGNSARAFQIASTLRQLDKVWNIEALDPDRGSAIISVLRARLVELEGQALQLTVGELALERKSLDDSDIPTFEVLLGNTGTSLYQWWKTGLERAGSVASIREKGGGRIGTGFLVKASSLGLDVPENELVVLTNCHVVDENGAVGLKPEDVEVAFEAASDPAPRDVQEVLWSSSTGCHDAAVLRLTGDIAGIAPLPLSITLPEPESRVYVIGHPGGRELAFSFQDNRLLDHEGPPDGQPKVEGVVRLHYRAPTEGGSSGSPVFNAKRWEVIALHHAGRHDSLAKLNGKPGTYGANEGISLASIRGAIIASRDENDGI